MTIFLGLRKVILNLFSSLRYLLNRNPIGPYRRVTELYPDPVSSRQASDLPKNSKGLLYNHIEQCIGCLACAKICPADCISIESQRIEFLQKEWVSNFDINHLFCIRCGLCTEVCPTNSLVFTGRFEQVESDRNKFIEAFGKGSVPEREVYDTWM
jgi:formate hydrogenlyase subunit 6/NADH:ubiquinone oxidoreductase subunit I